MIYNVSLHKQLSNIEMSNAVSMNKITKNAIMKHLLALFLSYCILVGLFDLLVCFFTSISCFFCGTGVLVQKQPLTF